MAQARLSEEDERFIEEMIRSGNLNEEELEAAFVTLENSKVAAPATIGGINIETSPVELPPPKQQTFGSGLVPPFDVDVSGFTAEERERAAVGVDVRGELKDPKLRSALGFSPNQTFSADFLARKLAEKTGLPAEKLVRFNPKGEIEFFNPGTRRFTPVDNKNFSVNDLRDFYGPATTIGPAAVGAIAGLAGGLPGSIIAGGAGAFIGEIVRLQHGKNIGVHDLPQEAIIDAAIKALFLDVAFGLGGVALGELRLFGRKLLSPEGVTPAQAEDILSRLGTHQAEIERINLLIRTSGFESKFKLDPVVDAKSPIGLELREQTAAGSKEARARRDIEIKENASALDDLSRALNNISDRGEILTNQTAADIAAPVQAALRAERQRIESIAQANLIEAENAAKEAVEQLGNLSRRQSGQQAREIVVAHSNALEGVKNSSWKSYENSIGQLTPSDEGFNESLRFVSNVKIPVTPNIVVAHRAATRARKASLLTRKTAGARPLKKTKIGKEIDLAVLDDDIKELRDILRRGDPGFSTRKTKAAENTLVKFRNDHLRSNNPEALALLEQAEKSTAVYKGFVDESVFVRILKTTVDGRFQIGDVDVFKQVFLDDTGDMMQALVTIAKAKPGGVANLKAITLQLYKTSVIPPGSNIPSRELHNVFIKKHKEVLTELFDDPKLLRFGELGNNVVKAMRRAERVHDVLSKSPLAKFGGIAPERMGKAVFQEGVSEKNIRTVLLKLDIVGPEVTGAFKDSVGREVYRRITTDGILSPQLISTLLERYGGKLQHVFGPRYVKDLEILRKAINLNRLTSIGPKDSITLVGMFARVLVAPPLTRKGRAQTLIEFMRLKAMNRAIESAVRDPKVLHAIIINRNTDVRSRVVLNILGQVGGTSLAIEDI